MFDFLLLVSVLVIIVLCFCKIFKIGGIMKVLMIVSIIRKMVSIMKNVLLGMRKLLDLLFFFVV